MIQKSDGTQQCPYCCETFKNAQAIGGHLIWCKHKKNGKKVKFGFVKNLTLDVPVKDNIDMMTTTSSTTHIPPPHANYEDALMPELEEQTGLSDPEPEEHVDRRMGANKFCIADRIRCLDKFHAKCLVHAYIYVWY